MLSDEWLPRYRLLENFTAKWNGNGNGNGNGNAYDRGDYNSSFALRAVELKIDCLALPTDSRNMVRLKKTFWPVLECFLFFLTLYVWHFNSVRFRTFRSILIPCMLCAY